VALVAALAADVELLLLDEPTAGLDPLMEAAFREVVADERHGGRTVLLSSHILSEVEALCDRVSIIRAGRIVESGTLAELRHLTRTSITAELERSPDGLVDLPGVHNLVLDGTRVQFQVDTAQLGEAVARLSTAGVRSLTSQPPTLEELFLRHYQTGEAAQVAAADGQRRPEGGPR
jgi:ABC-2 type transport system ATP-binding protein